MLNQPGPPPPGKLNKSDNESVHSGINVHHFGSNSEVHASLFGRTFFKIRLSASQATSCEAGVSGLHPRPHPNSAADARTA